MAKAGYLVIDPDGTTYVIPARRMGFERLRHLVGGPIDIVGLEPGLDMVINDEGKFTGAWNPVATHIFETFFGSGSDVVFGPVVLSGVDEDRNVPLVPGTLERMRLLATQADQSRRAPDPMKWVRIELLTW